MQGTPRLSTPFLLDGASEVKSLAFQVVLLQQDPRAFTF